MNGRQARGWGISAHERMNTTTKKAANSIVGKLTAGILATAAVAAALFAARGAPFRAAATPCSWSATASRSARARTCARRWRACRSRSTPRGGARAPRGCGVLSERLGPEHGVIVFPLGTNDSPSNPDGLAASLAAVQQLAGGRCVVVATIARPPPARGVGRGPQPRGGAVRRPDRRAGRGLALGRPVDPRAARARPGARDRRGLRAAGQPAGGGGAGLPARRRSRPGSRRRGTRTRGRLPSGAAPSRPPQPVRAAAARRRSSWSARFAVLAAAAHGALTAASKGSPEPVLGAP